VYDWAKRDEKVARKLAAILEMPIEDREKATGKALRALFAHGAEQERERVYRETSWCGSCQGAGFVKTTLHSPLSCCAAHNGYRYEFCSCRRGVNLKKVYEDLGSGKITWPNHWGFRRRDRGRVIFNPRSSLLAVLLFVSNASSGAQSDTRVDIACVTRPTG
jgi:hypothetical protein